MHIVFLDYFRPMHFSRIALLALFVFSLGISGCNGYNKLLKSRDLELKYEKALEYYYAGKYYKAYPLIEELAAIYRGQKRSEKLFYLYAYCDYYLEDYLLAAYRFDEFTKTFPTSKYTEECAFMEAMCQYKMSPIYELDQTHSYQAMSSLQLFVDRYPQSPRLDSANMLVRELELKIERKNYEGANQYMRMMDYRAAVIAYENLLEAFPDTKLREEVMFKMFKSKYLLSQKSVEEKKLERIDDAMKAYVTFVDQFPGSLFVKEAETYYIALDKARKDYIVENDEF
ncbi:MAG TPA: outer membrane protein assembly factor BamD [Flavobacteriales bacterium]|mgnify:CR=1 FL=1|jgi:outer membrane protein assembly factor BamD|nr:outer membrane protein assembly factor BamD [Flavobacteriales bacterium]